MVAAALFSSKTDQHATPQHVFDGLNLEFNFVLDAAADDTNYKCSYYFTKRSNGLVQDWHKFGGAVWLNPPYGREIGKWVKKAYEESQKGVTVVCLLPSRTDTRWFQEYVIPYGQVRFIKGRLKFGNARHSAPFPSAVVIFRPPVTP